jgi:hypothetical protein
MRGTYTPLMEFGRINRGLAVGSAAFLALLTNARTFFRALIFHSCGHFQP